MTEIAATSADMVRGAVWNSSFTASAGVALVVCAYLFMGMLLLSLPGADPDVVFQHVLRAQRRCLARPKVSVRVSAVTPMGAAG